MAVSGSNEISMFQMGIGLLPVLIAIFLSVKHRLGLTKSLIIGVIRGSVQLVAVSYILLWIFKENNPWVISAFLIFMVGAAAQAACKRISGLDSKKMRRTYQKILFVSIFLGSMCTLGYLQFVVVRPEPLWEGRYIVSLGGMLIAQAMNAAALVVERYRSELELRTDEIETLLALGANVEQATRETVRAASAAAMLPAINMLMVLGIVALPGMMSGQILAGVSPLLAVRYQLLICFCIAAGSAIVSFIAIKMTQRMYFTLFDQFNLIQDADSAS